MTEPVLVERITRSLAFMLRHQPEAFDLEVDAFGWADLDEVVRALNERLGEPVERDDVLEAVEAGDRVRYEIQGRKVRALYGHSIPVEPGEPSKPQEVLYVAIPSSDADRAMRFGLRGGRRRFLHLALSKDDSRESGRRSAREYTVLSIEALEAWEEGINFYDRHALWLAEEIPTHFLEIEGEFDDGTDPRPRRGRSEERGGRRPRRSGSGDRDRRPSNDDNSKQDESREERPRRDQESEREPRARTSRVSRDSSAEPETESNERSTENRGSEERGSENRGSEELPRKRVGRSSPRTSEDRESSSRESEGSEREGNDSRRSSGRTERGSSAREERAPAARRERTSEARPERTSPARTERSSAPRTERVETPKVAEAPQAVASPQAEVSSFGAGLEPERATRAPRRSEPPKPAPAPKKPEPKPEPQDDFGDFGSGL